MLWLVWRQHRLPVLVTSVLLLAFGTVLLVHGLRTVDLTAGLAAGSEELDALLDRRFHDLYLFFNWLPLVPALAGLFLGAPVLAREHETGTAALAWTQSVSPRRWVVTKLLVLGTVVTLCGLALGAMLNAWLGTLDELGQGNRFALVPLFGGSGVVSGAWWLFSFVIGVAAGTLLRRTVPAMAVALAAYVVAFVVIVSPIVDFRDMYAEPTRVVQDSPADARPAGSVSAGSDWLDPDGRTVDSDMYPVASAAGCPDEGPQFDYSPCLFTKGYRMAVEFYPPTMYWRFQWTETAILAGVALAVGGLVVWSARRPTGGRR